MLKKCTRCKEVKHTDEYYKNKLCRDGFRGVCRKCENTILRRKRKSCLRQDKMRQIKNRYKITEEYYECMLISQRNLCAICWGNLKLSVDHDHDTNEVRGLLCSNCNVGIGYLDHNICNLNRAIKYLDRKNA